MTFEAYMEKVDAYLESMCGLSSLDLPDWGYYDAYDDGVRPITAAGRALKAAGGF